MPEFDKEHSEQILDKVHLAMSKKDPNWQEKILTGNEAQLQQFHKLQRLSLEQVLKSSKMDLSWEEWRELGEEFKALKADDLSAYALQKSDWLKGKVERLEKDKENIDEDIEEEKEKNKSKLVNFLEILKAKRREEGEVWTQPSGRKVTKKNGKIVPAKGKAKQPKEKPEKKQSPKKYDPIKDYKQNGTKAKSFKDWFGDWEKAKQTGDYSKVSKIINTKGEPKQLIKKSSAIVNEKNEPIVMYHGTKNPDFEEFSLDYFGQTDAGWFGKGFYFTEDAGVAKGYADIDESISRGNLLSKMDRLFLSLKNDADYHNVDISGLDTLTDGNNLEKTLDDIKKLSEHINKNIDSEVAKNHNKKRVNKLEFYLKILKKEINPDKLLKKVFLNIKNPFMIKKGNDKETISYNKNLIKKLGNKELLDLSNSQDEDIFKTFGAEKFTNLLKSKGYDGVVLYLDKYWNKQGIIYEEVVAFEPNQIKAVDNIGTFDEKSNNIYKGVNYIIDLFKAKKRNVGETWTQPSGRKVKKIREGLIVEVNEKGEPKEKGEKPSSKKEGKKPESPKSKPKKTESKPKDSKGVTEKFRQGSDAVKALDKALDEAKGGGFANASQEVPSKIKEVISNEKGEKEKTGSQDVSENPRELQFSDIKTKEQYTAKKDYDKAQIEQLKQSIKENGFDPTFPIMVDKQNGKWTVVAGHHRYEAVKSLIEENELPENFKIPVVTKKFASDNDRLAAQVLENQRRNVLATDEAKAYGKMVENGWDAERISKKLGKKVGEVNKRLALNNLSKDLFSLVAQKDRSLPLGVAEAIGMFAVNDNGQPNETMQIKAFKWYQENKNKINTSGPVAIQSYIKELKSEGFSGFDLEKTMSETQKEALRKVGSAEKAQRNTKMIENMLKNLQNSYQRILGDSVGQIRPETIDELGASISAQGNIQTDKTIGTLDAIIQDLNRVKEALSLSVKKIQSDATIPLMFGKIRKFLEILKAKKRNEGEVWTQPSGRKVTKKNGKIIPVADGKKQPKEEVKKKHSGNELKNIENILSSFEKGKLIYGKFNSRNFIDYISSLMPKHTNQINQVLESINKDIDLSKNKRKIYISKRNDKKDPFISLVIINAIENSAHHIEIDSKTNEKQIQKIIKDIKNIDKLQGKVKDVSEILKSKNIIYNKNDSRIDDYSKKEVSNFIEKADFEKMFSPFSKKMKFKCTILGNEIIFKVNNAQADIERRFTIGKNEISVSHYRFFLPEKKQGLGLGKQFLKNSYEEYKKIGVGKIKLEAASVGRYAWAKFGFNTKREHIEEMKKDLKKRPSSNDLQDCIKIIDNILKQKGSHLSLRPLAMLRTKSISIPSGELGKNILLEYDGWEGILDLNDKKQTEIFEKYVGIK